jgi:hypothetical protein
MRQLDTCDFCGAAADGVYEVVPASVAGDPKRLALCADCRTTLQSVVDPLLDAADSTTTAPDTSAGGDASATTADADAESSTTAADSEPATGGEMDVEGETVADSGTAVDDALDAAGATDDRSGADGDDAVDAAPPDEPDSSPADHTDGITIEAESEQADVEPAENGDANAAEGTETQASEASRTPRPDGYAQIVRLLQNRDGAMPREDLRVLATNAYDIGGRQFEDAVDAAVETGDVEETADGLRTV